MDTFDKVVLTILMLLLLGLSFIIGAGFASPKKRFVDGYKIKIVEDGNTWHTLGEEVYHAGGKEWKYKKINMLH